MPRARPAIAGACFALAACGGNGDPPRADALAATPAATAAPPRAVRVRFRASDGRSVRGAFRPAAAGAAPAVVLVNGLVGGAGQWDELVPDLHAAGFATLAYDGRGGVDEEELAKEVAGAVAFLRGRRDVDARRLAIVGSSVGASTAVLAMTGPDRKRVRAAVALSPPAAPVLTALMRRHRYHPRNVLFLSDQRERATVAPLEHGAVGSRLILSEGAGHGVALLESEGIRDVALDWIEQHLG
jgi:dienelactone hydrolase